LQLVLVMPVLVLAVSVVFDAIGYYHARQAAQIAARQGVDAARVAGASPGEGSTRASAVLAQLHDPLVGPRVSVAADAATVSVRVEGTAPELVPGLHLGVHATAVAAIETFRRPSARAAPGGAP